MPIADGLKAHWKLDEDNGTAFDAFLGFNMTASGSPVRAAGKIRGARQFVAASSQFLSVASNADLQVGDIDFAVGAWVYLDSKSTSRVIVAKFNTISGNNRQFSLQYQQSSDRFIFVVSSSGTGATNVVVTDASLGSPSTATWYYVAGWHDSVNNQIGIKVNALTATTASHSLGVFASGTSPVYIGADSGAASFFDGRIDEVSFWRRVPTNAELNSIYASGAGYEYPWDTTVRCNDPTDYSGGYWLSDRSGVTTSGGFVTEWTARGTLSPGFTARTGSAVVQQTNGIYFPGGVKDFLYEATPIAKTNDHTIFGVIRPQQSTSSNGVVFGRYNTTTNERSWQVACDSTTARVAAFHSSAGTAATATALSPTSTLSHRYYAFVVRKSGTQVTTYWRSLWQTTATLGSSTLFDATNPTTIGSRAGDASTDGSTPFQGWIRHLGFYNRALTDLEMASLIDWLQTEEQVLVKGPTFGATAANYTVPTRANNTLVIQPNGSTPAQATPATHRYRHHVAIGRKGSRLWISHSSGAINEDSSGQQLHCWYSDNEGSSWTGPLVAIDSPPGGAAAFGGAAYESGCRVSFSRCFVTHNDALYVVGAVDKCSASGESTAFIGQALIARECKDDGTLGAAFRIENTGPGYSGAPSYDATLGPPIYAEANLKGIWGGDGPVAVSEGATWTGWDTLTGESTTYLAEPTTTSLDGTSDNLLRLWRCTHVLGSTSHAQTLVLWASVSYDGGGTWTDPTPTDVPNAPSSPFFQRSANGKHVLCWNAENVSGASREKLALMVFGADGKASTAYLVIDGFGTTPVYAGTYKSGGPAYPGVNINADKVVAAFSTAKENIRTIQITVPELLRTTPAPPHVICPRCFGTGLI